MPVEYLGINKATIPLAVQLTIYQDWKVTNAVTVTVTFFLVTVFRNCTVVTF